MKRWSEPERGSILVTMLFLISVVALLVGAVATDSMTTLSSVSQSGRDSQSKYGAHAALEHVMNKLRQEETYSGEQNISARHGRHVGHLDTLRQINYEVLIWNNTETTGGPPRSDMAGPNGVTVAPNTVYMVASATNIVRGEEVVLSSLAGTARRIRPVFEDGAYARTKMFLTGGDALVDAWDSGGGTNGYEPSYTTTTTSGPPGNQVTTTTTHSGTVEAHAATLGTDSARGRTARLVGGAKLDGHYRLGPAATEERAFGSDAGTVTSSGGSIGPITGGSSGGSSERVYAITTASNASNITGTSSDPTAEKFVVDDAATEMPRFVAPYRDSDVQGHVDVNNRRRPQTYSDGSPVLDDDGNQVYSPPAPMQLAPGGYESIRVPGGQTLELSPGVYYFRDHLDVPGGTIKTTGTGPVIVFFGKKATFRNASINESSYGGGGGGGGGNGNNGSGSAEYGDSSKLQICACDRERDDDELTDAATQLMGNVDDYGDMTLEAVKNVIAPPVPGQPIIPGQVNRKGFSQLQISGNTKLWGSVSGSNLIVNSSGGDIFGAVMANVFTGNNTKLHQDLALKGSNLMNAGGWDLEGVTQIR